MSVIMSFGINIVFARTAYSTVSNCEPGIVILVHN